MIDVNEIIERYERGEHDELGINREDFRESAEELVEELRELDADLDWWMGDKTKHEQGVLELGADPPKVSVREVSKQLDVDYEILMRLTQDKMKHNLSIIAGDIEEDGDVDGLIDTVSEAGILDTMKITRKLTALAKKLKSKDPHDLPLWTARLLKEHGHEEVSVRTWVRFSFLFDRVLKAETARQTNKAMDRVNPNEEDE